MNTRLQTVILVAAALLASAAARADLFDVDIDDARNRREARLLLLGPEGRFYYNYPWGAPYGGAGYPFGRYYGFQYPCYGLFDSDDYARYAYLRQPIRRPFDPVGYNWPRGQVYPDRYDSWTPARAAPRPDNRITAPRRRGAPTRWNPLEHRRGYLHTERQRRLDARGLPR
jgi:hypothetical protein